MEGLPGRLCCFLLVGGVVRNRSTGLDFHLGAMSCCLKYLLAIYIPRPISMFDMARRVVAKCAMHASARNSPCGTCGFRRADRVRLRQAANVEYGCSRICESS